MSEVNKISKMITDVIKESQNSGTSPYDTTAEVVRVDGDTVWVHIPGGVAETPVSKTIDASPGDSVQVRVADGRAWLTGNASAPPTDDAAAVRAQGDAINALGVAEQAEGLAVEVNEKLNNLSIGGKNLLLDTNAPSLTKVYASANRYFSNSSVDYITPTYIEVSDAPIDVNYGVRFQVTSTGSKGKDLAFYRSTPVPMIDGELYTMSAYFRVTSGNKATIEFYYGVSSYPMKKITITNTEWKKYSWTFTYSDSESGGSGGARVYFGVNGETVATVETCGYQLERGTFASDYSPNPEEVEGVKKHFFYRDDSGVHITMVENDYNTGRNIAMDSNGLDVRNGTTSLAYFGATSRVGQASQNNVQITDSGISFKKGNKELGSIYLDTQHNIGELDLYSIKCSTLKADESVDVGACSMRDVSSGTKMLWVDGDISGVKGGVTHVLSNKADISTKVGAWNGSASLPNVTVKPSSTHGTQELGSFYLEKGIYLAFVFVSWGANSVGSRYINLAKTPASETAYAVWLADRSTAPATGGGRTTTRIVATIEDTEGGRWFINGAQTSSSDISVQIRYNFVKIG